VTEVVSGIKNNIKQNKTKKKKTAENKTKTWNHVINTRAGPSLKTTLKSEKVKSLFGSRTVSSQISRL
jgi:hypothetical protein